MIRRSSGVMGSHGTASPEVFTCSARRVAIWRSLSLAVVAVAFRVHDHPDLGRVSPVDNPMGDELKGVNGLTVASDEEAAVLAVKIQIEGAIPAGAFDPGLDAHLCQDLLQGLLRSGQPEELVVKPHLEPDRLAPNESKKLPPFLQDLGVNLLLHQAKLAKGLGHSLFFAFPFYFDAAHQSPLYLALFAGFDGAFALTAGDEVILFVMYCWPMLKRLFANQ